MTLVGVVDIDTGEFCSEWHSRVGGVSDSHAGVWVGDTMTGKQC